MDCLELIVDQGKFNQEKWVVLSILLIDVFFKLT